MILSIPSYYSLFLKFKLVGKKARLTIYITLIKKISICTKLQSYKNC